MVEKPESPRWRLRFTLLGLLAFTAICAVGTQGYLVWQTHATRRDLQWAGMILDEGAEFQTGESIVEVYCRHSERLCEFECRMPLADKPAARRAHLERIIEIQRRQEALEAVRLGGDSSGSRRLIASYRHRAEQMVRNSSR